MSISKILPLLVMSLTLPACSTVYRQSGLGSAERSELAVIDLASCEGECPIVQEIDGSWRGIGSFREYEVKPGMRDVKFIYVNGGLSGKRGLIASFEAKPGMTYGVRSNADSQLRRWHPEIYELSTGKVVSTITGSGAHY